MMMGPALSALARTPPSMATQKMTLRRQTPGMKQLTASGRRGTCTASSCSQFAEACSVLRAAVACIQLQCSNMCRSLLLCRATTRERALLAVVGLLSSMHDTEGLTAR